MDTAQIANQGFRLAQQGKLKEARGLFRSLEKTSPEAELVKVLKGVILMAQGNSKEAIWQFQSVLLSFPKSETAYFQLGEAYQLLDRPMDAVLAYRSALEVGSRKMRVLERLTPLYQQLSRPDLAIKSLQASLVISATAKTAFQLANLLRSERRFEEAIASFRQAIALDQTHDSAVVNLCFTLHRQNRLDDCREEALEGLKRFPSHPLLHLVLSKCDDISGDKEKALSRVVDLDLSDSPDNVKQQVLFHLGRLHDLVGDPHKGFVCLQEANRLQAVSEGSKRYSKKRYLDKISLFKEKFTADWCKSWSITPSLPEGQKSPAFLVGFPRSGTTLLDQILDAHPGIQVMDEFSLINQLEVQIRRDFKGDYPEVLADLPPALIQTYRDAYFAMVERAIERQPGTQLIDKLPLNNVQAGLIHRLFPDALFISARRHPCDCVLSTFIICFSPNDAMNNFYSIEESAHLYDEVMTLWGQYQKVLDLNVVTHRYEDLIENLEGVVSPILTALGLEWDDAVTRYAEHARAKGAINTPSFHSVIQPLYTTARYRWQRYAEEMEPARKILAPHIEAFGYGQTETIGEPA
ncbi:tetratricopeptide repeat-containing sulfotransferase family protein [Rhodovibrionaceae bacterium A322]